MPSTKYDLANNALSNLPRSHKFLLHLGNLIQVKTAKNCSSTSIASALSSAGLIEDGISVNSLDGSLRKYTTNSLAENNKKQPSTNLMNYYRSPHLSPHLNTKNSSNSSDNRIAHEILGESAEATAQQNQNSLFNFSRRTSLNSNLYNLLDPPPIATGGFPFLMTNYNEYDDETKSVDQVKLNFQFYHNLKIPPSIAETASTEILEASKYEPYGLRGCVVRVSLLLPHLKCVNTPTEGGGRTHNPTHLLGHVICDPDTITTFQIELILKEDEQRIITKLKYMLPKRFLRHAPIIISPKYTLKKKRLFRLDTDVTSAEE